MTPLKVVYKYRPCGRTGPWHMWLARHDLQPKGFLAKFLARLLYVLLWTVIYATILIGGVLAPTGEYSELNFSCEQSRPSQTSRLRIGPEQAWLPVGNGIAGINFETT